MQRLGVNTAANMPNNPAKHMPSRLPRVPQLRSLARMLLGLPFLFPPMPAVAGLKDSFGTLRIGIVSPSGGRGVAGLPEITSAFEQATGVPVEILVAKDYPALIRAQIENRIHYASYSAVAYATAQAVCGCVEPVAAPVGADKSIGARAVLIGRGGAARSLNDASALRIVSGPKPVVGPQVLALSAVSLQNQQRPGGTVIHMATQSEAEQVFLAGDADLLVGWQPAYEDDATQAQSGTLSRLAAITPAETPEIVWSSQVLRYGPHAVRSDVPEEIRQRLRRFLINIKDQQPDIYAFLETYRDGGFAEVANADYAVATKIVGELVQP